MNKTKVQLPRPIEAYVQAINSHDPEALARCFDPNAVANDVSREFRGLSEIMTWARREIFAVQVTLELMGVKEEGGQTVLTARIEGTFDRTGLPDPLIMEHALTLAGDRILSLTCRLSDT
ncbi:MAG: nuclear transport factor 2 family protein [Verrucomicrobiales bacterium]|nr:nuclear transport factor 2 family protein [Verrucomicrobiales bacterium]